MPNKKWDCVLQLFNLHGFPKLHWLKSNMLHWPKYSLFKNNKFCNFNPLKCKIYLTLRLVFDNWYFHYPYICLDTYHQRCVNISEYNNNLSGNKNAQYREQSQEEIHRSTINQLAATCQQSVLSHGHVVSEAFIVPGHNCTIHGGQTTEVANETESYAHCPAGSICFSGKCYGRIKRVNQRKAVTHLRCKSGQM